MKAGDVFENPVTGEFGYIRVGTEETNGDLLVADLRVRPGGAVAGEHLHPIIRERFTVVSGKIGYKLGNQKGIASAGDTLDIPPGVAHDWWNAGNEEARVIVQVKPGARFVQMATTLFGVAKDGKTNDKGMPNLLQLAVIAKEYQDVIMFMKPPIWVQRIMFSILSPLGKLLGYKAKYDHHHIERKTMQVEPLPEHVKFKGL
jgi:quercetin dioxygenase-like cupin family protein